MGNEDAASSVAGQMQKNYCRYKELSPVPANIWPKPISLTA
jgi:hypothetical protein